MAESDQEIAEREGRDEFFVSETSLYFLMNKFGGDYSLFQEISQKTLINYDRFEFRSKDDAREFLNAFNQLLRDGEFRADYDKLQAGVGWEAPTAMKILGDYESARGRIKGAPSLDEILRSTDREFDRIYPTGIGSHEFGRPLPPASIAELHRRITTPKDALPVSAPTLHVVVAPRSHLVRLATVVGLQTAELGAAAIDVTAIQRGLLAEARLDWNSYSLAEDGRSLTATSGNDRVVALTYPTAMRVAGLEADRAAGQRLDILLAETGLGGVETAALANRLALSHGYRVEYHVLPAHDVEMRAGRLAAAARSLATGRRPLAASNEELDASLRGVQRLMTSNALEAASAKLYAPSLQLVGRVTSASSWRDVAALRSAAVERMLTPVRGIGHDVREQTREMLKGAHSDFLRAAGRSEGATPATAAIDELASPLASAPALRAAM